MSAFKKTAIIFFAIVMMLTIFSGDTYGELLISKFQYDQRIGYNKLYVGDDFRGEYGWWRTDLFVISGHTCVAAMTIKNRDYSGLSIQDLQKDRLYFAFGLEAPLKSWLTLSAVYNHDTEQDSDESIDLFALYPTIKIGQTSVTIGYEHNAAKKPEAAYVFAETTLREDLTMFTGASVYSTSGRSYDSTHYFLNGGVQYVHWGLWMLGGASLRFDGDEVPYTFGIAYPDEEGASGINPRFVLVNRHKPISDYNLGILTFGENGLSWRVPAGMNPAFVRGTMEATRVLGLRNLNIGVGDRYTEHAYGTTVVLFTNGKIRITDDNAIKFLECAVYRSFNVIDKVPTKQYVGVVYDEETEIRYDFVSHSLVDESRKVMNVKYGNVFSAGGNTVLDLSASISFWNEVEGGNVYLSMTF